MAVLVDEDDDDVSDIEDENEEDTDDCIMVDDRLRVLPPPIPFRHDVDEERLANGLNCMGLH